jgi:excisionase family DNA binding protein
MSTLYTANEVAEMLNCRRKVVYRLLRVGELRGIKLGEHGDWRIQKDALDEFLERNEASGREWEE